MTKPISGFKNEYRFLSNFWPCMVQMDGEMYHSIEHAFQASKTLDPKLRKQIQAYESPDAAKRCGNKMEIRGDWDSIKLEVMETLLREKFQIPFLRDKLMATQDAELIEYNTWGDKFWGVCMGRGENHLGKLLIKIRNELRQQFFSEEEAWERGG